MSELAKDGKPNFKIGAAIEKKPAESIEELSELEKQLQASLDEIHRRKEEMRQRELELERLAKMVRKIVVDVKEFTGAMVIVESDFREDLLEVWKRTPGRMYRGSLENAIPVGEWNAHVVPALKSLPNVTISYRKGIEEAIDWHLNAPSWMIEIDKKALKLTPGPGSNSWDVSRLPGIQWMGYQHASWKHWRLPLSEAYRLYDALKDVEGVLWSDEARDFTIKQVEDRGRLDEIGMAETWNYDAGFVNGYKLRPFQGVGCAFIEATGGRALLAYEMGLGKTPMSLAYAWKNKLRTVIICPASLKANWSRQVRKFTGESSDYLFGAEPGNHDLIRLITTPKQFTIINYDILARKVEFDDVKLDQEGNKHVEHKTRFLWVEALNMMKPDLVIVDESHYIKNTESNRSVAVRSIITPRIIHMTGTPVLNRPGELWPILTMISPDTFPSEELFISQYTENNGKSAKNVEQLKETLKSMMIRRKHSDVKKDLPPINRIEEYHELSSKAQKLYRRILEGVYEKIAEFDAQGRGGTEMGIASILAQIMRLKQVCAIDKVDRTAELAVELHESAIEDKHNKVLIMSQFKGPAFAIAQRLGHEALCFVSRGRSDFVTADNAERDRLVQQFQSDPNVKYLVATANTIKEGHDCTEAGFVIANDLLWTPANHEQFEGRAFMREIDPHGISSYYVIVDKEGGFDIEDWIWQMLKLKTDVINATVEGVEQTRDSSVAMQIIEKMREAMWTRKR